MRDGFAVAVIGTGPRGVSVIERLVTRIGERGWTGRVTVYAIDAVEVGCGRTWRTDQPDELLMDNSTDELTMFSGPADDGPVRAGHGPTLAEWYRGSGRTAGVRIGDAVYAPRRAYGEYLREGFDAVRRHAPEQVRVVPVHDEVVAVTKDDGYAVVLKSAPDLLVDRVVFATGHPEHEADAEPAGLGGAGLHERDFPFVRSRPAAEMDLDRVVAGSAVGVLGMGLSFYDVLISLTAGRGGEFVRDPAGTLRYRPSGAEPARIVAGSRTAVPIRVRGVHQRLGPRTYAPVLFTEARVRALRARGKNDFAVDVQPWVDAEVNVAYFRALLAAERGQRTADRFARVLAGADPADPRQAVLDALAEVGAAGYRPLDLRAHADPFRGVRFADPAGFQSALCRVVREDLEHAEAGNIDDPLKSALEVLRTTRDLQRLAVDHGGLTPAAHRAFVSEVAQPLSFLSAGTPLVRAEQFLALVDSGHLGVVGPRTECSWDPGHDRLAMHSPQVAGSRVRVDALVDARLPRPDLHRDSSPLTKQLIKEGIWNSFVNRADGEEFDTGGVAVTEAPFHPLDSAGDPDRGLYVLGLPTEHVRWFMQVGTTPPGYEHRGLGADSEAVVADLLRS
ncbi:FAD/NAD(P)-binding protein [Saccharopolyspora sp. MS10]|uniref:FAD/NAD(P)-binding protein n=1 Tax=Saccharopolyspora sp. MS10 TaxID=3385973 RepID=UPI0039A3B180